MKKFLRKRVYATADRGDALIGIYWYTPECEVIGLSEPVDNGQLDGQYLQFSGPNHLSAWREVISNFYTVKSRVDEVLSKGFKSMYRGRCMYSTMTQTYIVTCSADLVNDNTFRSKIKDYFQLGNVRVEFQPLDHYKYKSELTGNFAIDEHYFDV